MDKAVKKLFAVVNELEKKLSRLDELEQRLGALDTNGRLDDLKKEMAQVAANSRMVVTQVEANGNMIANMEKTVLRLNIRCPLMKPDTSEFPKVLEEPKCEGE
jgi:hypothetical protein